VKIEGKDLPAGEYAFYTMPGENEWTIIFSKKPEALGRIWLQRRCRCATRDGKTEHGAQSGRVFYDRLRDLKDDSATITLDWDKTHVPVALTTNTMEKVNAQIAEGLKKPAALQPAFYYQAASFYYDHEKDLEQAAKWIDTAIEKQKEPRYFYYYKKGQIEAKLGHKDQAKAAAEKSIELLKADPIRTRPQSATISYLSTASSNEPSPIITSGSRACFRTRVAWLCCVRYSGDHGCRRRRTARNECGSNSAGAAKAERAWSRTLHRGAP
jgi:tetratricopeptide (TPR) repeat protein